MLGVQVCCFIGKTAPDVVKFMYTNLTTLYTNLIYDFKIMSNRCQNYGKLVSKLYVEIVYQIFIHKFEICHTILKI